VNEIIIEVDFSDYPDEYEWLINSAKESIRSPALEIIAIIRDIRTGIWEWQG